MKKENDIYTSKDLVPMTIGGTPGQLDDPDYLYELKFDGYRCLVYLNPQQHSTEIRSKRNNSLTLQYPELVGLYQQVKVPCVLDGELVILTKNGFPDFETLQSRSRMRNPLTIQSFSNSTPATLIVFDILYAGTESLMDWPLLQRKKRLEQVFKPEQSNILEVSVYTEGNGNAIISFAAEHGLEGAIAKQKESLYCPGVRTKEWYKIKLLADDDFVVCGYVDSEKANVTTLILGQYDTNGQMVDMGHVVLGRQREDYAIIKSSPHMKNPPFTPKKSDTKAAWLKPSQVCTVTYSYRRPDGTMRHAKYKALRSDKLPQEAVIL